MQALAERRRVEVTANASNLGRINIIITYVV
jgi:hypothetical protein